MIKTQALMDQQDKAILLNVHHLCPKGETLSHSGHLN